MGAAVATGVSNIELDDIDPTEMRQLLTEMECEDLCRWLVVLQSPYLRIRRNKYSGRDLLMMPQPDFDQVGINHDLLGRIQKLRDDIVREREIARARRLREIEEQRAAEEEAALAEEAAQLEKQAAREGPERDHQNSTRQPPSPHAHDGHPHHQHRHAFISAREAEPGQDVGPRLSREASEEEQGPHHQVGRSPGRGNRGKKSPQKQAEQFLSPEEKSFQAYVERRKQWRTRSKMASDTHFYGARLNVMMRNINLKVKEEEDDDPKEAHLMEMMRRDLVNFDAESRRRWIANMDEYQMTMSRNKLRDGLKVRGRLQQDLGDEARGQDLRLPAKYADHWSDTDTEDENDGYPDVRHNDIPEKEILKYYDLIHDKKSTLGRKKIQKETESPTLLRRQVRPLVSRAITAWL